MQFDSSPTAILPYCNPSDINSNSSSITEDDPPPENVIVGESSGVLKIIKAEKYLWSAYGDVGAPIFIGLGNFGSVANLVVVCSDQGQVQAHAFLIDQVLLKGLASFFSSTYSLSLSFFGIFSLQILVGYMGTQRSADVETSPSVFTRDGNASPKAHLTNESIFADDQSLTVIADKPALQIDAQVLNRRAFGGKRPFGPASSRIERRSQFHVKPVHSQSGWMIEVVGWRAPGPRKSRG